MTYQILYFVSTFDVTVWILEFVSDSLCYV